MVVNATTQWSSVGGQESFRTQWVVGSLSAGTNYTAWITDGTELSEPIWFTTKESESDFPWHCMIYKSDLLQAPFPASWCCPMRSVP
jgi:hypothetical protein